MDINFDKWLSDESFLDSQNFQGVQWKELFIKDVTYFSCDEFLKTEKFLIVLTLF